MNQCNFIGRVGKDPEIKNGKIATFSLAVSEKFKDKDGNSKEVTEWVNVVCFSQLTQVIERFVKKGDLLYISGKLKTNEHEGKKYTNIVLNEMQMLGSKQQSEQTIEQQAEPLRQQFDGVIEQNGYDDFGQRKPVEDNPNILPF